MIVCLISGIQVAGFLQGIAGPIAIFAIIIALLYFGSSSLNIDLSPVRVSCSQHNVNIPYSDIDQVIYQETKQYVYRAVPGRVDHYPPKITPRDVSIKTSDGRVVLLAKEDEPRDVSLYAIAQFVARRTANARNSAEWREWFSSNEVEGPTIQIPYKY